MRILSFLFLCGVILFGVGCLNGGTDPESTYDPNDKGKADDTTTAQYPIRLERATPEEVAASFSQRMGVQLDNCFENYKKEYNPDAKMITIPVLERFKSNYPYSGEATEGYCFENSALQETIKILFAIHERKQAYPETIKQWFEPWAIDQLKPTTINGFVDMKNLPIGFFDDLVQVQDANAVAREKDPTGVDLDAIRTVWKEMNSGTLDKDYLNPVILDPKVLETDEIWAAIRIAFPLYGASYVSSGTQAIDDFRNADEGVEGDPAFGPIAEALAKPSITKRFYFSGYKTDPFGWSTNVILVLDEHGQMWGMQIGYSE